MTSFYEIIGCYVKINLDEERLEKGWKEFKSHNSEEISEFFSFEKIELNEVNRDIAYFVLNHRGVHSPLLAA